jgi:streptogramin lyase
MMIRGGHCPSNRRQPGWRWLPLVAMMVAGGVVSGCGGSASKTETPPPTPTPVSTAFTGQMRSGTQPVTGATISFYAAGTTGLGTGATNLLPAETVTTDASGNFSIPADFQCPSATAPVYLVGRGGNPGLTAGTDNPALIMMSALGNCGNISSSTSVLMNEITTAASAWTLAQFMSAGGMVGATATNANGLSNAFLTVGNLVDNSKGSAPGPTLPSSSTLETSKLNTLADILWTCNSAASASACQSLFAAVTDGGAAPSNTLDAALNIVRNPGMNAGAIFALAGHGPFQPALTAAPSDWTLSVTYGSCASGCGGLNLPGALAIDSTGNIWVANYFGGAASKFSPLGVPAAANGFSATGIEESFGITVDGQDSVWITNEDGNGSGSVTHLSSAGDDLSGSGYTGGGISYPTAVAATSGGNIWVADHATSTASLLANNGTAISGASGYATSALPFTTAVAVDANQNGWFAFEGGVAKVTPANVVTAFSCCEVPDGIALDQSGQIWVADYDASALVKISSAGAVLGQAIQTGGLDFPVGVAVDGSGNIWTANYRGNTLSEFNGATLQPVSPAVGYALGASLYGPFGLGIDASGNLWASNAYGNTLTELVGVAAPIKTPLLGLPAQP